MFKDRLRELRKSSSYSMDAFCDIYNKKFNGKMNKSTLSRYENGLQEPMFNVVKNIANIFNVTTDYLTGEENTEDISYSNIFKIENMGEKIKYLRTKNNMTLEEVGNAVGVGKSTVRKWETGQIVNMRRDKIAILAKTLHTTPAYLMGWEENTEDSSYSNIDNIFKIEKKKIPLLGEIACGEPIYADEDRESYVMCGTNVDADFCLKAKGDSMINARIMDGDIVFIKKQPMVDNGEIAVVLIDDEATLKRFYYDKEASIVRLVAENPAYKTMVYSGEELNEIRVLGKAVAFQSDVV